MSSCRPRDLPVFRGLDTEEIRRLNDFWATDFGSCWQEFSEYDKQWIIHQLLLELDVANEEWARIAKGKASAAYRLMVTSEGSLAHDWDTPEEDEAWRSL